MAHTLKEARRLWGGADFSLPPGQQEELMALEAYKTAMTKTVAAKRVEMATLSAAHKAWQDAIWDMTDEPSSDVEMDGYREVEKEAWRKYRVVLKDYLAGEKDYDAVIW